jgi:endonuclease/exonuclease/phosphatase family metal-dependent hydrolase
VDVTVGTFNLNNLFDRFNFDVNVGELPATERDVRTTFRWEFVGQGDQPGDQPPQLNPDGSTSNLVRFQRNADGRLITGKSELTQLAIAARIGVMNADVLAVQEVENREALQEFNRTRLAEPYPFEVLIEGNDARFIDVGVLSRFPVANTTSHRFEVHPDAGPDPVFSRDLLQVDVLAANRRRRLFTVFVNHLKSKFVPFNDPDPQATAEAAALRRRHQVETVARIVRANTRPGSRFVVLGDMNDGPESPALDPLRDLGLSDALTGLVESRPPPPVVNPVDAPPTVRWSSRFAVTNGPDQFDLLDQIWLSPALAAKLIHAQVERRPRWTATSEGVGSDHDPVWIRLSGL